MKKIIGFIIFCLCVLSACKHNEPYTLKRGINIAHENGGYDIGDEERTKTIATANGQLVGEIPNEGGSNVNESQNDKACSS